MRKKLFPIVALALGALSLASCQKDTVDNAAAPGQSISRYFTFSADVEDFTPESRTAFDPDANKVVIEDGETVAVGVIPSGQNVAWEMASDTQGNKPIILNQRVSDQKFEIAVLHSGTVGSFDYFFVHPAPNAPMSGTGTASNHQLPQQQLPSVNGVTFDAQGDILIGKMQTIAEPEAGTKGATNDMEVTFKRLFVPFKVILSDVEGLINGEAVKTVEFSAPGADAPLTGAFSVHHSATAAEITYAMSSTPDEVFRSVMADYDTESLAKNADGTYNVWYVVNPTTLHGTITLTVSTPTRKLTCKVTPGDPVIEQGKLNSVTVKMQSSNTQITSKASDLEAIYDAGEDFYIGNVKVNKTLYPNKLTITDGDTMPENVEGIYFLETGTYMLPKIVKNVVVIGKPTADVTVKSYLLDARTYTQINESLLCRDIKFVAQRTNGYSLNNANPGTGVKENFVMDQCRIEFFAPTAASGTSLSAFSNVFKNIVFRGNKITIVGQGGGISKTVNMLGCTGAKTDGTQCGYVELVDNVIYATEICKGNILVMDIAEADTDAMTDNLELICTRNTIINFLASGAPAVTIKSAKSFTFKNNLFWTTETSGNNYGFRIGDGKATSYTGNIPTISCSGNGSYNTFLLLPTTDPIWTVTTMPIQDAKDKLSDDPFLGGTFDPATMSFIPADAYKQYGARTW